MHYTLAGVPYTLLALGATLHADHRRPDGAGWVMLLDPEGNEFCAERSAAERDAS